VLGDSVNKARCLQEQAKGGQILLSQDTLDLLQPHLHVKQIGWLHLQGQAGPEPIYELIGLKSAAPLNPAPLSPVPGLTPIAI
jgi:class 3 adenylate cyclase